jgi:hypothetical protein
MKRVILYVDRVLRGAIARGSGPSSVSFRNGLVMVALGGSIYGLAMGAFGGLTGEGPLQMTYSAVKVPMLIVVTAALAMPSFFVLNSLLGLRSDFAEVLAALALTQTAVAIILASLAPYTVLWYASTADYEEATLFNAVMFAVASLSAQWVLRRRYVPLIARNPRHRIMLRVWLGMYAFVGIQMGWVLRPFIGKPGMPVTFFREGAWSNAYVSVVETVWTVLSR